MNGNDKLHPGGKLPEHNNQSPRAILGRPEELIVAAKGLGQDGEDIAIAVVLVSPDRFYIDLKTPELLEDRLIVVGAGQSGGAAGRRAHFHALLERWLTARRGAPAVVETPPPTTPEAA